MITKTYRPSFTFVVGPRIGTALYRDWKNENDHVWKSFSEITKGVPQDHKVGLRPVTPEDKEKVEWSYRLHSLLHDLPYYYYEEWATYRDDMAPNMINSGGFEGSYHPQAAKVEEERYEIENKIYDLFPRYEEDKEVLKGQP